MYKALLITLMLLSATLASAQIPRPPESIRIPVMPFDESLIGKVVTHNTANLPLALELDDFNITIGQTTLREVLEKFQTNTPLYNGRSYYQCYSLPLYSHQLWFVTDGADVDKAITEIVVRTGDTLPTEYCPRITSEAYPTFSNSLRLTSNVETIPPLLGKPLQQNRTANVYLFQLSPSEMLKVQIQRGKKGIEMVKLTQQKMDDN